MNEHDFDFYCDKCLCYENLISRIGSTEQRARAYLIEEFNWALLDNSLLCPDCANNSEEPES